MRAVAYLALAGAIPLPIPLARAGELDVLTATTWAVLVVVAVYAASVAETVEESP
jgi:hypothetical protein